MKIFDEANSASGIDETPAIGRPAASISALIIMPPWFCKSGAKTAIAKNPYATEGIAANSSTTGLKILEIRAFTISLRHIAAVIPSGTATAQEPTVTINVP